MSSPGDIDLSSLGEEADRLLTGLSDDITLPQSDVDAVSAAPLECEIRTSEFRLAESNTRGIPASQEGELLFNAAVSELKRQGVLKFSSSPPSIERSRITTRSYVLCDIRSKVIGRIPLASLYPRIAQSRLTSHHTEPLTPPKASPSIHQQSDLSNYGLDRPTLLLISDCTPHERIMFMSEYNAGRKSVTSGVILALLFGGFGIHKFWLGNVAVGMLYLVFCWTFIPGIVALIDACMMGNSVQRYNEKVAEAAYRKIKMLR